jgi:hypothetical protein
VVRLNDITIQSGQTGERGQQVARDAKAKDCKANPHSAASGQCGREGIVRCVSGRQPLRRRSGSTALAWPRHPCQYGVHGGLWTCDSPDLDRDPVIDGGTKADNGTDLALDRPQWLWVVDAGARERR